jgi:peptidylprolyl isomerase
MFDHRLRSLALLIALLPACSGAVPRSDRPADDLLSRSDLQLITDLQEQRDATVLRPFLNDPDPAVRSRAAFALASVQAPEALPELLRLLSDDIPAVRAEAAFAVGQLGDSTAAPVLLQLLENEGDPVVRRRCLEALGKCGGHGALAGLSEIALPPELLPDLALAVARFGMRTVFSDEALAFLLEALSAEDPELRRNAAYFFGRMGDTGIWQESAGEVRRALDLHGLDDPAGLYLVQGLGRLGAEEDADRLLEALTAADWRVRSNAAAALGSFTDSERVRRTLLTACDDPSRHVGISAARSLAGAAEVMTAVEIETLAGRVETGRDPWQVAAEWLRLLVAADRSDVVEDWLEDQPEENEAARTRAENVLNPPTRRPPRRTGGEEDLPEETGPPPAPPIDWTYLAGLGPHPRFELVTAKGIVTVVLLTEEAPLTVQTVARLAEGGYYDGVAFHRVVANFVVQGGDTGERDPDSAPPDPLRSEFTRLPYERGVIGVASSGKDTEGSQYFITHSMQPHLDGRYTAFGYVIEGMDVVDTLYEGDRVMTARIVPGRTPY